MSDADAFVKALRDIDGVPVAPVHCTGHMHRMRIHGLVGRAMLNGQCVWRLTEEGRLRAFPTRGALRVTAERVRMAINYEAGSSRSTQICLYKTFTARNELRLTWYTPKFDRETRSNFVTRTLRR